MVKKYAQHDKYGKERLGCLSNYFEPILDVPGYGIGIKLDGKIKDCAIEIESRTPKQIRGAILDLLLSGYKKKLLIVLPLNNNNEDKINSYEEIFYKMGCKRNNFRVILLEGHAKNRQEKKDEQRIREALRSMRIKL